MRDELQPGVILEGEAFPEPVRVLLIQHLRPYIQVGGQRICAQQHRECLQTSERIERLQVLPTGIPLDGARLRFHLAVPVYENYPYFSPLPQRTCHRISRRRLTTSSGNFKETLDHLAATFCKLGIGVIQMHGGVKSGT